MGLENSDTCYERENRQSARREFATKLWPAQAPLDFPEKEKSDASADEADEADAPPVVTAPGFAGGETALANVRIELTKAACVLMAANSSLGPHDAVGDVFQVYEELAEFMQQYYK